MPRAMNLVKSQRLRRIRMTQLTECSKFHKKEGPSEDASIPLRRGEQNSHQRPREEGTWVGEGRRKGKGEQEQVLKGEEKSIERVRKFNRNM